MIKAILFDVDGVLLDSFDSNLQFTRKFFIATGYKPPTRKDYVPLFYLPLRDVIVKITGLKNKKEVDKLLNFAKSNDFRVKDPLMTEDVVNVVRSLGKHYKLGIVTSRVRVYLFETPMDSLEPYFETSVAYEDTKKHKPNPEPLLLAATRLKTKPSEIIYIGDAQVDMLAAKAAGMKFILFSKKPMKVADVHVKYFSDIPSAISKIGNGVKS